MNHNLVFDAILITRIREGDRKAQELLIKRWHKRLISFSYKLTKNLEVAQDVVQDCWIIIIKSLRKLKDPKKFKSWAFRIVHNKSIDWIRKQKPSLALEDSTVDGYYESEAEDENSQVAAAFKKLKDKDRIILSLFYLEGNTIYEIAEILGVPTGTVKSRIFYAREHLKKKFKDVYHE
ncbi:MAG: RNA polymerase sigma factor [Bacteroidota bacterium]